MNGCWHVSGAVNRCGNGNGAMNRCGHCTGAIIRIGPDRAYPLYFTQYRIAAAGICFSLFCHFFLVFGPYPLELSNFSLWFLALHFTLLHNRVSLIGMESVSFCYLGPILWNYQPLFQCWDWLLVGLEEKKKKRKETSPFMFQALMEWWVVLSTKLIFIDSSGDFFLFLTFFSL